MIGDKVVDGCVKPVADSIPGRGVEHFSLLFMNVLLQSVFMVYVLQLRSSWVKATRSFPSYTRVTLASYPFCRTGDRDELHPHPRRLRSLPGAELLSSEC